MTPGRPSGRIVTSTVWLMASFALTIVSFTTATVVADRQARGIEDAATTISDNVLTATESLANVRTELRHVSALTNELARGGAAQRDRGLLDELQQARASTEEIGRAHV